MEIVIGITGATGAIYGIELLEACKTLGVETHLILSDWAKETIKLETSYSVEEVESLSTYCHNNKNLGALPSSGSFQHDGMVIAPCSMKSLAAIACGFSDNLIQRSADVTIKERRKLIIMPRETPFSPIHLENMLKLVNIGAVMIPPMPSMYIRPNSIDDLVKHTISRVLDQLNVDNNLSKRWDGMD